MTAISPHALLCVEQLGISFQAGAATVPVTHDVSFEIVAGERVGMVGESGCGKTVTGLALLRLLNPQTSRLTGRIRFEGTDLLALPERNMQRIRGARIGMIFQEPMSALDPVFTIGQQIAETLRAHGKFSGRRAFERAVDVLDMVGIPLPRRRADNYPHQLSGGMRQRAMIAIALACEPALLIADEPTTALDVTVQAQILDLLISLSERTGAALLLITHDLGVVAEACTRVLTLYAGEIVEDAPVDALLTRPLHPYSSGLLRSLPRLFARKGRLQSIPGRVPAPLAMPPGCRFAPRCPHSEQRCELPQRMVEGIVPQLRQAVRCCRAGELTLRGSMA